MSQQVLQAEPTGLQRLKQSKVISAINRFVESPWYIAIICLLTVISSTFGGELIAYTVMYLSGVYLALFGRDFLPFITVISCSYLAPSISNNPGRNADSIFYPQNGGIYLGVLFVLFATSAAIRLIKDPELGGKRFWKHKRKLMPGFLLLAASYLTAGAFSGRFYSNGWMNLAFVLLQIASYLAFYWFFAGAVKWEKANPNYFSWFALGIGLTVCCEILNIFLTTDDIIAESIIHTGKIASGWGNANNIGCMAAMTVPLVVGLGQRTRKVWLFGSLSLVIIAFVCMTCSRTSIAAAAIGYAVAMIFALRDASQRKKLLLFNAMALVLVVILVIIFHGHLERLFRELLERGLEPRMREKIYPEGIRTFLKHPIFGEGFYPSTDLIYEWANLDQFKSFMPARWHNTVIQLLASGGLVAMGCYSFHRIQTIRVLWKQRKTAAIYIGISILTLLLMSLLDCHFFNFGPPMYYAMALAFAENIQTK